MSETTSQEGVGMVPVGEAIPIGASPTTIYSDRSRAEEYHRCHRARYLGYEIEARVGGVQVPVGVTSTKLNMDLVVGGCYHVGVEQIYKGAGLDEAVGRALEGDGEHPGYWKPVRDYGFNLEPGEDASYVVWEQAALIEALIRAYAYSVLPKVSERFYVIEVEKEEQEVIHTTSRHSLVWQTRHDALLMEKDTWDLYVMSEKTTKEWDKRKEDSALVDMQGMSESFTVERRLEEWYKALLGVKATTPGEIDWSSIAELLNIPDWFIKRFNAGFQPMIQGVRMQYALKGRRTQYPEGSGRYTYSNPLIRPWRKSEDLGGSRGMQYATRFETDNGSGGKSRLGRGWTRVNIWEDGQMGVKEWIELLANETTFPSTPPGFALENQFVLPEEYFRNPDDIARWKRQIAYQEGVKIPQALDLIRCAGTWEERELLLDQHFPMFTRACHYPSRCQFKEVCHGAKAYLVDPVASGLFRVRTPNHVPEREHLIHITEVKKAA
jgi:hypothetical protein